jgi:stearoyl-CoA desaturase (delta-9 desaturase)
MESIAKSLAGHRAAAADLDSVRIGTVRYAPVKSLWFLAMLAGALIGGVLTFSWRALALFLASTAIVLLFGHSLGSHRKLVHNSYQCPQWLEYLFVYLGVQVGLAGPIGLLRQHELRDYAQRLPTCHDYLRHGRSFWLDAWWQLNCELSLRNPPNMRIEARIANDRFYRLLEATWMAQHLPWAVLFYYWGGWGFVCWGVCARATAGVFGHWLIGYLAHNHGGMHHEVRGAAVQGRNVRLTSLLTMGECWHNNHHAFPGSAKLGLAAGEWDPGWWVLCCLQRLGLVWGLKLPADLPYRPELVPTVDAQLLLMPSRQDPRRHPTEEHGHGFTA